MSVNIYNRINRSINENIILIYYLIIDNRYTFYVLGTSGFIYNVEIDKKYQKCNCDDYEKSKLCKHICFILFRVLKVFRFNKKSFEIKLPYQNTLHSTEFLNKFEFDDYEWMIFKNKYRQIKLFLKSTIFNYDYYNTFLIMYNRYIVFIKNKLIDITDKCII